MENGPDLRQHWEKAKALTAAVLAAGTLAVGIASTRGGGESPAKAPATPSLSAFEPDGLQPGSQGSYNEGAGAYYYYVGGTEVATAGGVSAIFDQAQPKLGGHDDHTLTELAAISTDTLQQIEIGWIVWRDDGRPAPPELFVNRWVDGQIGCFNGCDFVPLPTPVAAGDPVQVGVPGKYAIEHIDDRWLLSYNDNPIGYYPDAVWDGRFTQFGQAQAFGEVSSDVAQDAPSEMGNGIFGSEAGSTTISHMTLLQPTQGTITCPPVLEPFATAADLYDYGSVKAHGVSFGGPGGAAGETATTSTTQTVQPAGSRFEAKGCEPRDAAALQQLARILLRRSKNPDLQVAMPPGYHNDPMWPRLVIPTSNDGAIVASESFEKRLPNGKPDVKSLATLTIAAYDKNARDNRAAKKPAAWINFVNTLRTGPTNQWTARYGGRKFVNSPRYELAVPERTIFQHLLAYSGAQLRLRADRPQPTP